MISSLFWSLKSNIFKGLSFVHLFSTTDIVSVCPKTSIIIPMNISSMHSLTTGCLIIFGRSLLLFIKIYPSLPKNYYLLNLVILCLQRRRKKKRRKNPRSPMRTWASVSRLFNHRHVLLIFQLNGDWSHWNTDILTGIVHNYKQWVLLYLCNMHKHT